MRERKKCFLDMDGVLVDFVGGILRSLGIENPWKDRKNLGVYRLEDATGLPPHEIYGVMARETFWENLEPTPECFRIVGEAESFFGPENVYVLTMPTRDRGCVEGKLSWLRKHLLRYEDQSFVGRKKYFCASPNAWLVDDSTENVDAFVQHGGHGVLLPRPWNTNRHLDTVNFLTEVSAWLRQSNFYARVSGPETGQKSARVSS